MSLLPPIRDLKACLLQNSIIIITKAVNGLGSEGAGVEGPHTGKRVIFACGSDARMERGEGVLHRDNKANLKNYRRRNRQYRPR